MRSVVWEIFKKENKSEAVCSLCKNKLKFYGSTTNLKKHLTRLHPIQYKQLIDNLEASTSTEPPESFAEQREEHTEGSIVRGKGRATGDESSEPSQPQPKRKKQLKLFGGSSTTELSDDKKKEIDEKLLKMIVQDFQPLSFVENKGFKDFSKSLNALYSVPSRKYLTDTLLKDKFVKVKSNIKEMLCEVNYVSVTTDIWTSDSNIAYVSLTCHFSYKDKLNSQVLSTDEISGAHTGENIGNTLTKILNEWGIMGKVVTVVSDNGSNIKNAINEHLKKHNHPCVAHTLNLCVNDSIKENETFSLICKKTRSLVSYFKHSVQATEKLKTTQIQMGFPVLKIKQDVSTRWNSTLFMLERLLEIKDALSVILSSLPKAPASLNATEWSIVWDCVPVLKPIEIITSVLSAEKYPTISIIIPLIRGLQHTLQHINPTTDVGIKLKQSLLEAIGRRLVSLERDKMVAKATILDPRFKGLAFGLEENSKNAESWIIEEVKQIIIVKNNADSTSEPEPNLLGPATTSDPSKNLWAFFDDKLSQKKSVVTPTTTAMLTVKQYLQLPNLDRTKCPFEFWSQNKSMFPELYELAQKYLSIPGTSVPSERIFSKAGQLTNVRRNRLLPKNLNQIIFLNSYYSH